MIIEGCISGIFSLLFLITFSSLTNQWSQSREPAGHYGVTNVNAAIAFSFFSVFIWVSPRNVPHVTTLPNVDSRQAVCSVLAFRRFQGGQSELRSGLLGRTVFGETPGDQSSYQSIGGYNQETGQS